MPCLYVSVSSGSCCVFQSPCWFPVTVSGLHFIISSYSEQAKIKAVCQEPVEHACIINHVCGFVRRREKKKKKHLVEQRSKGKGHQRENNFQLVRVGSPHTQIQEARTNLSAAWPCTEIHVCVYATRSVTENIWCNWSLDPGFRHLKLYAVDFRELIIPLCSLSLF